MTVHTHNDTPGATHSASHTAGGHTHSADHGPAGHTHSADHGSTGHTHTAPHTASHTAAGHTHSADHGPAGPTHSGVDGAAGHRHGDGVAAWVAGRPIAVAAVEERLAVLRRGPYAARLPHPATAEGRNLRRWLVQVLTVEAVVEHEAHALGLSAGEDRPRQVTLAEALRTGGVTAAVVAAHPLARSLRTAVAPTVPATEADTAAYFHRNRDRHPQEFALERDDLAARLGAEDAERRFARWLDERCAALVHLEPGYEHPGDPRHPDAVHRH